MNRRWTVLVVLVLVLAVGIVGSVIAARQGVPPAPTSLPAVSDSPTPAPVMTDEERDDLTRVAHEAWETHVPVVDGTTWNYQKTQCWTRWFRDGVLRLMYLQLCPSHPCRCPSASLCETQRWPSFRPRPVSSKLARVTRPRSSSSWINWGVTICNWSLPTSTRSAGGCTGKITTDEYVIECDRQPEKQAGILKRSLAEKRDRQPTDRR